MFAPRRASAAIVLPLVLTALIAATLVVVASVASAPSAQAGTAEFVTTGDTPEGWLLYEEDGTLKKLWISASCRAEIEGTGFSFDDRPWSEWGNLPDVALGQTCLEIQALAASMLGEDDSGVWRLVALRGNGDGWIIRTESSGALSKQYLNSTCRNQIEVSDQAFQEILWREFGPLPETVNPLTCSEVVAFVAGAQGDNPQPPAQPDPGEGSDSAELFGTVGSSSGWLVRTSNGVRTKQWVDDDCRSDLESEGQVFPTTAWTQLSSIPSIDIRIVLSCADIGAALLSVPGNPSVPLPEPAPEAPTPTPTPTPVEPTPTATPAPTNPTGEFTVVDGTVYDPNGNEFILRGMNVWAEYFPYSGWDASIIEDRDAYLELWNLNAMRLNIICETACEGSLETHLEKNWVTVLETVSLEGEDEGYVIYKQGGTKYRQWVDADCRQRLESLGYGDFPVVEWKVKLRPVKKAAPNRPCAEHLPIDDIISAYAGTETVFIIDYHVVDFPNAPTQAEIASASAYLANLAERYKDNPYVWFTPFNEPLNECDLNEYGARLVNDDGSRQTNPNKASATWYNMQLPVIDAIRATGNTSLIVANASNYGQDRCDSNGAFDFAESSIIQYGQDLIDYDPEGRVIFDMHFYSRWSRSSMQDINRYFNELAARNLPVLLGEIGGKCFSQNIFKHDLNAAKKLLENWDQVENPPLGAFVWHAGMGFPLTTARGDDATRRSWGNLPFEGVGAGNAGAEYLTKNGRIWWDWVHPEKTYFGGGTSNCW